MDLGVNGCVTTPVINEKIDALMECDKIYVQFMESRLKIQEEQLEFLHRLHSFHYQFSINKRFYIQFRTFREECEEISDKISRVEKELELYQKKFETTFARMFKNSIRRSTILQQLKNMTTKCGGDSKDLHLVSESKNASSIMHAHPIQSNEDLLQDKISLEEDWITFSEFADQEILACHSQFYILCKEFVSMRRLEVT